MVYSPEHSAVKTVDFVTNELGFKDFDILIPDHTWEDQNIPDISDFYIDLINYSIANFGKFRVRQVDNFFRSVAKDMTHEKLGINKSVGFESDVITVLPDGAIEINDIFRITKLGSYSDNLNIFSYSFSHIHESPLFNEINSTWKVPSETCLSCEHVGACQGGHVAHRYSKGKRFDNPSRHCVALQKIYHHVKNIILKYNLNKGSLVK